MAFPCPKCKSKTIVVDSRINPVNQTRRRRQCTKCKHRFSTTEIVKVKKSVIEEGYKESNEENVKVAEEMEDFEDAVDDMDDEVDARTEEIKKEID